MNRILADVSIRKTLPVKYPMLTMYTQHAHLLSILSSYEETYSWIFSNYIQLYIFRDYHKDWGDFYFPLSGEIRPPDTCKWIISQKIHRDTAVSLCDGIVDFIITQINSNNYVHLMLNYFEIPISFRYHCMPYMHDILIYGYDLENQMFQVADFFMNGVYSYDTLLFSDVERGFQAYNSAVNEDYLKGMVYLYKYNPNSNYHFDIKNSVSLIKNYLEKHVPEYWSSFNAHERPSLVFGMGIYETIKNYICQVDKEKANLDIRPFCLVNEHKKMMKLRFDYFNKVNVINVDMTGLSVLEGISKQLVYMTMKYRMLRNNDSYIKIINIIDKLEDEEYKQLSVLIEKL